MFYGDPGVVRRVDPSSFQFYILSIRSQLKWNSIDSYQCDFKFGCYKHSTAKSLLRVHVKYLHIIVLEALGSILKLTKNLNLLFL